MGGGPSSITSPQENMELATWGRLKMGYTVYAHKIAI